MSPRQLAQSETDPRASLLPLDIPEDHRGPVYLSGTRRLVFWTGRVAIGLRHERSPQHVPQGQSALWIQQLLLDRR